MVIWSIGSFFDLFTHDDGQSGFLDHDVLSWKCPITCEGTKFVKEVLIESERAWEMRNRGQIAGTNVFGILVNFNASTVKQMMATWRWTTIEMVCLFVTTNDDANEDKSQN